MNYKSGDKVRVTTSMAHLCDDGTVEPVAEIGEEGEVDVVVDQRVAKVRVGSVVKTMLLSCITRTDLTPEEVVLEEQLYQEARARLQERFAEASYGIPEGTS